MKRIALIFTVLVGVLTFNAPAEAHDETHPETMQAVLPGQYAHVGWFNEDAVEVDPEFAVQCSASIRPTRTSAVGNCLGFSGKGSRQFVVQALAWKCARLIWMTGSIGNVLGGPYYAHKKSFVYTPPGGWIFIDVKVVAFKP